MTGYVALREARNLYAFEGVTQIGLGLDRQRPFRVTWVENQRGWSSTSTPAHR